MIPSCVVDVAVSGLVFALLNAALVVRRRTRKGTVALDLSSASSLDVITPEGVDLQHFQETTAHLDCYSANVRLNSSKQAMSSC